MAEGQESSKKITITVKTLKEKQTFQIEEDADIKRVSVKIINRFHAAYIHRFSSDAMHDDTWQ